MDQTAVRASGSPRYFLAERMRGMTCKMRGVARLFTSPEVGRCCQRYFLADKDGRPAVTAFCHTTIKTVSLVLAPEEELSRLKLLKVGGNFGRGGTRGRGALAPGNKADRFPSCCFSGYRTSPDLLLSRLVFPMCRLFFVGRLLLCLVSVSFLYDRHSGSFDAV